MRLITCALIVYSLSLLDQYYEGNYGAVILATVFLYFVSRKGSNTRCEYMKGYSEAMK